MSGSLGTRFFVLQIAVAVFFRTARLLDGSIDNAPQRAQRAHRVGVRRVPGQHERLTAASSEVDGLPRTAAARLRHPLVAAECLKPGRLGPDPLEGSSADVLES